jgi:hypothetical protein
MARPLRAPAQSGDVMTVDQKLSAIRDVIQVDIGKRGLARDLECNLFNAYPDDFANACRSIAQHPSPNVAIVTGFYIAAGKPPAAETDGPPGAIYLARVLSSFGVPVMLLTDGFLRRPLGEGLQVCDLDKKVAVFAIPPSETSLSGTWIPVAAHLKLTHIVAIERVGPARDDRCYTMRGLDVTDFTSPAHLLIEHAARRNPAIVTIGIGDGGNEIGCGAILEAVQRVQPFGRKCICPCGAGVATVSRCDHLVFASISNWGAYAVAAALAGLLDRPDVLHDVETEQRMLAASLAGGAMDGAYARLVPCVDGTSAAVQTSIITLLHQIVVNGLTSYERGF